jgi:catechol 2,3-dioxygenase-like lactoylglutathione lyase family enzyme
VIVARVTHLRYVGMAVPDFDQAVSFYGGAWGLTEVASDKGVKFFAAEGSRSPTSTGFATLMRGSTA